MIYDAFLIARELAEGIYVWSKKGENPERLKGNILALFQKFKAGYDSKNATEIYSLFANSYSGNFYGTSKKADIFALFSYNFNKLPAVINPNLNINVYQIFEDTPEIFKAIIDFQLYLTLLVIPIKSFGSGRIYIEISPEPPHGIWKITHIDTI